VQSVLIVIPAWNEQPNIVGVTDELRAVCPAVDLLVVDDGSNDETARVACKQDIRVLALPFNLGYGAAVQAGIKFGLRQAYDVVVTFDADGQHDPHDISPLVQAIEKGADLAVGSRTLAQGCFQGTLARRSGRRLFALLARCLAGINLTDPTSGLKALGPRCQALFALSRFPDRFPDADALVLARRARLKIVERPAHMRPSRNRRSMHDGLGAVSYGFNMLFALLVASTGRETDLGR
jgi:glycosyltransferase involved in cell wall biosynthesis